MATILLANELGDGLGHVTKLAPMARAFAERGHEPVFAVTDIVTAASVLGATRFPLFQAPVWRSRPQRTGQSFRGARSFADILTVQGYDDADALFAMVEAWQRIMDVAGADLVVADHSPTACLAAYGGTPAVVVGTGFTVPPAETPKFPVFQPNLPALVSHEDLLESISKVQRARGRPAPDTVPGLYGEATCLICTLPELDPYRRFRQEPAIGPIVGLLEPAPIPENPRFFAYLHANRREMKSVLSAITQSGIKGAFHLSGGPPGLNERLRKAGFDVYDSPPPLSDVLPSVSVIIHHGGQGTTAAALSCGRPQILMPRHFEQTLCARAMVRLGVAAFLPRRSSKHAGSLLRKVIADEGINERAQERARKVQERDYSNVVPNIVERCLGLLP